MKVFFLWGQSNMSGRGLLGTVKPIRDERIRMWRDGQWRLAVEPLHQDKPQAGVGLAMSFALRYVEAHPDTTVGLVPSAVGGTPLSCWVPGGECHENAMNDARSAIAAGGEPAGLLWHQGEADSGNPELAATYAERFVRMIRTVRGELGPIPVVVGEVSHFPGKPREERAGRLAINEQLRLAAGELDSCGVASEKELTDIGDSVHVDAASLRVFGKRYADVYERLC
jgi:hypothetical protein